MSPRTNSAPERRTRHDGRGMRVKGLFTLAAVLAVLAVVVAVSGSGSSSAQPALRAFATVDDVNGAYGRVAIAGDWILRGDKEDHGRDKGWQAGGFAGSTVTVPFVPNAKRITGEAGIESFRGSVGWYRTTFSVPADGPYALRFESVNHRAEVWVDGRKVADHVGEYLPFEEPVQLKAGDHTLVVRADWRHPERLKREAWHRTWFNFGGINRPVTIRPLGASDLTAPAVRTRLQPDGSAQVDVSVHVRNRGEARQIAPTGTLAHGDQSLPVTFPTLDYGKGQTRVVTTTLTVPTPALWSPAGDAGGAPNLYELDLEVAGEAAYHVRTGLRELRKDGQRLEINGKPVQLRGASIHEDAKGRGDALRPADMDKIVANLKAIGANATRAQHPLSPPMLQRLDAAGIMVWMGVGPVDAPGAWTSKTPKLRKQSEGRVRTSLFQLQTHPSIIAWNLANEVAGNGHPGGQASYIDEMARELKRRDPGRLVALDVWGTHPPKVMGPMYRNIDAIGDTNYIGWYSDTLLPTAQVETAIRQHVASMKKVFAGKLLVITEFGAEANGENAAPKPGSYSFQAELLRRHIDVYQQDAGLNGMLVWNLADFAVAPSFAGGSIRREVPDIRLVRGLNQKGLFRYDGSAKPSVGVVKGLLAKAGATFAARTAAGG